MLDARNIYRKVTRKIYDFSPEQQQNLTAVVWLHRDERLRFAELCENYRQECIMAAAQLDHTAHSLSTDQGMEGTPFLVACLNKFSAMLKAGDDCFKKKPKKEDVEAYADLAAPLFQSWPELQTASAELREFMETHRASLEDGSDPRRDLDAAIGRYACNLDRMKDAAARFEDYRKLSDRFGKQVAKTADLAAKKFGARRLSFWKKDWNMPELLDELQRQLEAIAQPAQQYDYFRQQLHWLLTRFPEGRYTDVPGLCKRVTETEIEAADWSLTPGRYVGVAPVEEDEDFDFAQTMTDIHHELAELDKKAGKLGKAIQKNFEGLGV